MAGDDAIYRVDIPKKWVALTFDIGWGGKVAPRVIRVLRRYNVNKATFFLSGPVAQLRTNIVKLIQRNGFEIGSHGYLHENYTSQSKSWIRKEVRKAERVIFSATGIRPRLIRTPNGDMNPAVIRQLSTLGYRTIHWSVDSLDWKNPGVKAIIRNTTHKTHAGDIILLHASDSAKQTAQALPYIIQLLRAKGFSFVSVTELLNSKKT
ncbi:polysaccharide deacetylase family protein [Paenibacillus eucommiae]|uniref:Polysaccharide deacetylase family sporulation protein PdaB n=1 Tax=Paenibacillus eucommiae TaxID=1355755 RepID=A0ABS4IPX7_9BACL|nr:polysaccharide deacetylase family protein [Paenibacillus eucommiae]MBP1989185.1 polysaccharide deacetylase family sporulation protein PdaB [Paenibacillus eucommiae]